MVLLHIFNNHFADGLLQSADVGVLVTSRKVGVCGKAFDIGGMNSRPLVIVADSPDCLDQWSLDHEIGHLLGARHNPEAHQREPKKYGYGKLLQPGEAGGEKGFGTIMVSSCKSCQFYFVIHYKCVIIYLIFFSSQECLCSSLALLPFINFGRCLELREMS
jgi:hypothetical protein